MPAIARRAQPVTAIPMTPIDPNTPLGQLPLTTPGHRQLLTHLGIDSHHERDRTLTEVCQAHQLEPRTVGRMLEAFTKTFAQMPAVSVKLMMLSELCDHLEQPQQTHLHHELKKLDRMTRTAAEQKGEANPQFLIIRDAFVAFRRQLVAHLRAEAQNLFPMIRQLATGDNRERPTREALEFQLVRMETEHNQFDEALAELGVLVANKSLQLQFPAVTRRMTAAIVRLGHIVHEQIYHENQVLFPRALAYKYSA